MIHAAQTKRRGHRRRGKIDGRTRVAALPGWADDWARRRGPAFRPRREASNVLSEARRPKRSRPSAPQLYDRISGLYDRLFDPFEGPLRDEALRWLEAGRGERIVELGVGTGRALRPLAERVGRLGSVVGMDLARSMLARATRRVAKSPIGASVLLVRARIPPIPLAPASCDAVFMAFTLELFDPPQAEWILTEIRRALRPAGRLVVASLSQSPHPGWMERAYVMGHRWAPRLLDCAPIDLDGLLRQAGYDVRRAERRSLAGIPVRLALAVPSTRP
jgi:ubiquinone/menaquinone biosynthesis C-methylase UbiE